MAPSSVFEGDRIVLKCQYKYKWKIITVTYYKDKKEVFFSYEVSDFIIQSAVLRDSGKYQCAVMIKSWGTKKETSRAVDMEVQELFLPPVLTARPSWPTEGSPVTLTCETQISRQRSDVQLQFCFFRDSRVLGSGWSSSPELQIPTMWNEDSGSYQCQVETTTHRVRKGSLLSQIQVQRVPISNVSLQTANPGGQVIEGGSLILRCSVAEGTGNITFSWHRGATDVGSKTQQSLSAELELPAVKELDAGDYFCRADNGHEPKQSKLVNVPIKVPVSRPVLILGAPPKAVVGDVLELHCEAQRGSPPIRYRFYHEDVILGNSSAPAGGGVSFNLSLTAEHSGNYTCEADNGLGVQRSEPVAHLISGTDAYGGDPIIARVLGTLSGILGFIAVTLLFYCHPKIAVDPVGMDVVYSQVLSIQNPEGSDLMGHHPHFNLPGWERSPPFGKKDSPFPGAGQVPMLLWLLLILGESRGWAGQVPKAFLHLDPPWSTAFKGETMTLRCENPHSSAQEVISWYSGNKLLEIKSKEIRIRHSGIYKCKTQGSLPSDPVVIEFSSASLILQAPYRVFEGEDLVLNCRMREDSTDEKIYYKDGERLGTSNSEFKLKSVSTGNSKYHCGVPCNVLKIFEKMSNPLQVTVQELFPPPVIIASPSLPIEGSSLTLKCQTQLPPQKSHIQLQFSFFKENQALGSGWSSSPELQIPTVWSEDSGLYWCQAQATTHRILKKSQKAWIQVKRVPVSDVSLMVQPPKGQLIEGDNLILICSVAKGTGTITFSWHKEGTSSLGRKTQRSLSAKLQIPSVTEHHTGRYYCSADNIHGPVLSKWITVTPKIPVSRPVLTLRTPRAQAKVGDVVELHCKAQRGSPPILYRFYHEDVILGNSSAPAGGGVSFNLSLTEEHSGNYSCVGDNGLRAQRSDTVTVNILVPVSHPVLTLWAVEGDVVVLHCEAQRGSPPILYRFYHGDITLGKSSAPTGEGGSFNLSLTTEPSGNYSCEADNGLGAQRSETVNLQFPVSSRSKISYVTVGVAGGLLSALGIAVSAVLVGRFRTWKRSVLFQLMLDDYSVKKASILLFSSILRCADCLTILFLYQCGVADATDRPLAF
ncbi:PREDICTED: Fc receptor-like protein 3 [Condylura cristata]|uniref:Fc receptor-like protein 3 n=1 Tax=Condylura cristata TaxID=143302 RepID=UPI000642A6EA|nr:PREDICTED: Fc receptor-like protein 3 [Condylura cristata]